MPFLCLYIDYLYSRIIRKRMALFKGELFLCEV